MLIQEGNYKISVSRGKEILVSINSRENYPGEKCSIIYDGRDHALFYRNKKETILLDYVTDSFRDIVPVEKKIYVAELLDGQVEKFYIVPVKMVSFLPEARKMPRPSKEIMQEIDDAAQNGNIQEVGDRILEELGEKPVK
jgi:hypothetical protein